MDRFRYFIAVLGIVTMPAGLLFWMLIHPWAAKWRRLGPLRTYLIVVPAAAVVGVLTYQIRRRLVGADLGTSWTLVAVATALYLVSLWIERQYWKHQSIATLAGFHELSPGGGKGRLLREGIYGVIRHPRYLSAGIALVGNALISNYAGFYILILLILPPGYLLTVLEERELAERFGEEYREYQRQVPGFFPRLRR